MKLLGVFLKTYVMKILLTFWWRRIYFITSSYRYYSSRKIAERCRQALQELTIFNNQNIQIHVSASFGISSSAFANDPYLVIRQADQALYAVKASGRNQVRTFHQLPQIKSI